MTLRSVAHTSFVIERDFSGPPGAVFRALSDPDAKRQWSDCHSANYDGELEIDFRPGGSETNRMIDEHGTAFVVNTRYFDIVADARIVYAYDILVDETRLSASLVTVELSPAPRGSRMKLTEQVAFLDGHQRSEERIEGTKEGFERLERLLARERSKR